MAVIPLDLGSRIRKRRQELGMTQEDLARATGLRHHQTISLIELNQQQLRAAELPLITRALSLNLSDLLGEVDPGPTPRVLWRDAPGVARVEHEARFLMACRWYAHLEETLGLEAPCGLPAMDPKAASASFPVIGRMAEKVRERLGLGGRPAEALLPVLERNHGVKIWFEDLDEGSSACSIGDYGPAVLLNRRSAP